MRRLRQRMEQFGYQGLVDMRRGRPSPRRTPVAEVERILELYRERYSGFNARHFFGTVRREHGVKLSYSCVRQILQGAGLIKKRRARGRHRRRRERRPRFGEMLHLDGSRHAWLALVPEERQTLIQAVDDAISRLRYAQLWPGETTRAVMTAMREVVREHGMGVTTLEAANAYLRARYLPTHNEEFAQEPTDPTSALVELGDVDLEEIFFEEAVRTVGKDNTVGLDAVLLQIEKQAGRRTCAGLAVQVRRHLDGGYTVRRGTQLLGAYDAEGHLRPATATIPTRQDASGSTQAARVDSWVLPAISSCRPSGRAGSARVPASGRLRLPPAGTPSPRVASKA